MTKYFCVVFSTIAITFMSCSSDSLSDNGNAGSSNTEYKGVTCTIPNLNNDDEGNDVTRSTVVFGSTVGLAWETGEKITVFSDGQNKGVFTLKGTADGDSKTGIFDGGGFSLTNAQSYYTISKSSENYGTETNPLYNIPCINGKYTAFNADQYTNIKMSYAGQRQAVNGSADASSDSEASAHLGKYDYLTAVATATEFNVCHFQFQRLGCILRIVIKGLPVGKTYKRLTMYDASENLFREMARTTNITNGNNGTSYTPYLNDVELNDTSYRFSMMLGKQVNNVEQGLTVPSSGILYLYMIIPPVDLSNKTTAFLLEPLNDTDASYYSLYKRTKPFKANTAVQMTMTASECTEYTLNIQVMQDWAKGNTVEQTRATGDPGQETKDYLPAYLYAFFVNNGKLVQLATATPSSSAWSTSDDISTLSDDVEWSVTTQSGTTAGAKLTLANSNKSNPRVYIVGSPEAITEWKDASGNAVKLDYSTDKGTAESVIQGLSYNYPTSYTQDAASVYMQSLYSTPFVNSSSFVGTLGDAVKQVRLYHVASKVDINWENTKKVTYGGYSLPVALSGSVSLNNIPTTNLSFFNPTTNEAGTGSVSTAITTATAYNGRAAWFVPQVKGGTYNVTIGSTTQDITFSADATFTSWFRGLVTIE